MDSCVWFGGHTIMVMAIIIDHEKKPEIFDDVPVFAAVCLQQLSRPVKPKILKNGNQVKQPINLLDF